MRSTQPRSILKIYVPGVHSREDSPPVFFGLAGCLKRRISAHICPEIMGELRPSSHALCPLPSQLRQFLSYTGLLEALHPSDTRQLEDLLIQGINRACTYSAHFVCNRAGKRTHFAHTLLFPRETISPTPYPLGFCSSCPTLHSLRHSISATRASSRTFSLRGSAWVCSRAPWTLRRRGCTLRALWGETCGPVS